MVRAKQNPTPITERRTAESKPNKAVVNTRSPNRVLSKIKPSKVPNAKVVNSSKSAKEIAIDDNDKPSNTSQQTGNSANVKKTVTSTNSTSASNSISKMSDVLINKQGVSKVAISKTATVSTNSNASVAPKIAIPRVLPTTALPPKYVFIKIDRPPRIFEQLRTVRTAAGCYVSVPSITSTPTVSQKDKSIVPNVQQKDQSKTIQSNLSKQMENKNILSALLQNDKNKNTESNIQQKEQNKINNPNILQKDQSPNTQPSDQDVSTVENDQSSETKQSNVEKIQTEILNTKFLPIKPKPPGYQVLLLFLLIFSIYIVKVKISCHN